MIQGGLFLIGSLLALTLAVMSIVAFRRGIMGIRALAHWLLFCLVIAVLSFFPGLIDRLAGLLTVRARGLFVLTVGVLVAFVMIYNNYLSLRKVDRTLQQISQEIAILRYQLDYGERGVDDARGSDDRRPERGA